MDASNGIGEMERSFALNVGQCIIRFRNWRMEDNIIWDKVRTRPWNTKGQLRNVHEYVTHVFEVR